MLDCFDGLTGLARTCDAYATDPVVPLESYGLDELTIGQFLQQGDTVASLIHDCEQRARAIIGADLLKRHASRIIPRTFLHAQRIGEADGQHQLVSGQTGMHGVYVEVNQPASNVRLSLSGWRFYAAATEQVVVRIYDLSDGREVDAVTIGAVAGQITSTDLAITIALPRRQGRFFIAHDRPSWGVQMVGTNCSSCTGAGAFKYGGVTVSGASLPQATPMLRSNLRLGPRTGGLSVVIDVACDHGQYLCESRDIFAPTYASKVAELILRRGIEAVSRMNSQRINAGILDDRAERAAAEYDAALGALRPGAFLAGDDICFSCTRYTRTRNDAP